MRTFLSRFAPPGEAARNLAQRLRLRRREPWNWCLQTFAVALLPFGILTHSPSLLVAALLGLIGGCLPLPLPPMQHTELKRLVPRIELFIGWENAWLASPMDGRKKRRIAFWAIALPLCCWFLWDQDLGPIGLLIISLYLLHVRRANIASGIKP